jgi:hydrogenase maturation factor
VEQVANVSSTSAVGVGSFATASFRSAEVVAQISQVDEGAGVADYQVGKYLMIHDGTTVTVIEQAAVSTGDSMIGSFDGAINGSNAELRVNMVTSGIATVTTKISTVTV